MSDLPVIPVEKDPNLKLLIDTSRLSQPKADDGEQPEDVDPPPPIPEGDA